MQPLVITAAFVLVVWFVALQVWRQQHLKMTFDFNNRLLDRSSMKEFSEFLQTEQGSKFIQTLTVQRPGAAAPSENILRAMRTGIILTSLGLGLLFLGYLTSESRQATTPRGNIEAQNLNEMYLFSGVLCLSLGAGSLISSIASYRLARTLGALDGNTRSSKGGTLNGND